ncbi:hypothetical protein WIW50_08280 [Flavobacteriaceae bacterium 3-367]
MRYSVTLFILLFSITTCFSQNKYEREHRILKKQFPPEALAFISQKLESVKRIRFYKEIDSTKTRFEAKFKKDRLHYNLVFSKPGTLKAAGITIKEIDIPSDSWDNVAGYLNRNFKKIRIKKIQQQYPVSPNTPPAKVLFDAFQNLLLPYLNYEVTFTGKKEMYHGEFEVLFDAQGNLIRIRKSLPANHDHVLY